MWCFLLNLIFFLQLRRPVYVLFQVFSSDTVKDALYAENIFILQLNHYDSLPALTTAAGWDATPCRFSSVDAALPGPTVQHQAAVEFSLFSKRLFLLGWSSPCVGPKKCKYVCVWACVYVCEFVSCCLHILWINFVRVALQVRAFAQNCTNHGIPSHVISHGCILRGW